MDLFFYAVGPIAYGASLYGLTMLIYSAIGAVDGDTPCEVCGRVNCEPTRHETPLPVARTVRRLKR